MFGNDDNSRREFSNNHMSAGFTDLTRDVMSCIVLQLATTSAMQVDVNVTGEISDEYCYDCGFRGKHSIAAWGGRDFSDDFTAHRACSSISYYVKCHIEFTLRPTNNIMFSTEISIHGTTRFNTIDHNTRGVGIWNLGYNNVVVEGPVREKIIEGIKLIPRWDDMYWESDDAF